MQGTSLQWRRTCAPPRMSSLRPDSAPRDPRRTRRRTPSRKNRQKRQILLMSCNRMECYESLQKLLANKDGVTAFRDFLKSEFSDENIEFWLACEDFKKAKTSSQLAAKANKIYSEYIKTEAPREVNIDQKTRELITQKIPQPTVNCFDDAQQLILCLMSKDSFPRFLRSEQYKELLKKEQNNGKKDGSPFSKQ